MNTFIAAVAKVINAVHKVATPAAVVASATIAVIFVFAVIPNGLWFGVTGEGDCGRGHSSP